MPVAHPLEISTETCRFLSFLESSDHHQSPGTVIVTQTPVANEGLIRINMVIDTYLCHSRYYSRSQQKTYLKI
jgi:hypothetical protein